jgi:hypothetical protein
MQTKREYLIENDKMPEYILDYIDEQKIHPKLYVWYARELRQLNKKTSKISLYIEIDTKKELSELKSNTDNMEIKLDKFTKQNENITDEKLKTRIAKNKEWIKKIEDYSINNRLDKTIELSECYKYIEDHYLSEKKRGYDLSGYSLGLAYILSTVWHNVDLIKKMEEKEKREYKEKNNIIFRFDDYYVADIKTEGDLIIEGERMGNCIGGYGSKISNTHRFFSIRKVKDNHPVIDCEYREGKFIQIKGFANKEIKPEYQFVFIQFLFNLCNNDEEKVNYAITDSDDFFQFGEKETVNGEIKYFYIYKGDKYRFIKFLNIEDPE